MLMTSPHCVCTTALQVLILSSVISNALSINNTFGEYMGDEAHITSGNAVVGLVLIISRCNRNIDLSGTDGLCFVLGANVVKDPYNVLLFFSRRFWLPPVRLSPISVAVPSK